MVVKKEKSEDYERGFRSAAAGIKLFGYTASKAMLEINHPKGIKGPFKSKEKKEFVAGCIDGFRRHNPKKQS